MFKNITLNGTHRKEIGKPIIRAMNNLKVYVDLQYERHYKMIDYKLKREREFQEYLKLKEMLKFRRDNLIKLLKNYFTLTISPKRTIQKGKKKLSYNSFYIKEHKFLYYKIIYSNADNYFFMKFRPCLLPLAKTKQKKRSLSDGNINLKFKMGMTPAQIKKFVLLFGYVPENIRKDMDAKRNQKNRGKTVTKKIIFNYDLLVEKRKLKKQRNISANNFRYNSNINSFNSNIKSLNLKKFRITPNNKEQKFKISKIYSSTPKIALDPKNFENLNFPMKKSLSIRDLKKKTLKIKSNCLSTLKSSAILSKNIKISNKINEKSNEEFKEKNNEIAKAFFKNIKYKSVIKLFQKVFFKREEKKDLDDKYKYLARDKNGHIHIKKIDFIRKPKSQLSFIQDYEQKRNIQNFNKNFFDCDVEYEKELNEKK